MKSQANRNYISNDCIQTPINLALDILNHFKPTGTLLEPCKGDGNFIQAYENYNLMIQLEGKEGIKWAWCEITEGKDFFDFKEKVDWIITNPPWSQVRKFLQHGLEISNNICFLITINHLWTKARLRDIKNAGFGIKEICMIETPDNFPQLGFQIGMIHLQRNYIGDIKLTELK
jgi:hypothetical protein